MGVTVSNGVKAKEPGFYFLSVSDKNNGMVDSITVKVPNGVKNATRTFSIVGECKKDGTMEDLVTGREIPFLADVNSIVKPELVNRSSFEVKKYYYSKPCYLKAKYIPKSMVLKVLNDLEYFDVVSQYVTELNRILDNSSLDYESASRSSDDLIADFKNKYRK